MLRGGKSFAALYDLPSQTVMDTSFLILGTVLGTKRYALLQSASL